MGADVDLTAETEALFKLPLSQFTSARNALATRLSQAGRQADAAQVKALGKPPVSAWVVNQLYWRAPAPFNRLLSSAADLRRAQATRLAGKPVDVQEPLKAQRDALNELSRQALAFLSQEGHAASPDVLRRVTLDLQGLAARAGTGADTTPLGHLTADVDAPGFETLAALVPKGGTGTARDATSRVLSFPPDRATRPKDARATTDVAREEARQVQARARRAAAQKAIGEAERSVVAAKREAAKAESAMKRAAAELKNAERERERASALLEKAAAKADAARGSARKAAAAAADAAQWVDDAERALTRAREQQAELD
jgi:hypothetical protein